MKKQLTAGFLLLLCILCIFLLSLHLKERTVQTETLAWQPKKIFQQKYQNNDYLAEMDKLNENKVDMDNPRLISLIRNYWIENPSEEPYDLQSPNVLDPSVGQAAFVDNRLEYKENGFYVECGALNGETRSNTLLFERLRNWNGLLIEGDPSNYRMLRKKHRKAFTINACLSVYPFPAKMKFAQRFNTGKIVDDNDDIHKGRIVEVQCFPLYSILLAINVTRVDFFSLDVEGAELQVLKTIPFGKVNIKMMTVEYKHIPEGEQTMKRFVENKGYSSLIRMSHYKHLANDIIFRQDKMR